MRIFGSASDSSGNTFCAAKRLERIARFLARALGFCLSGFPKAHRGLLFGSATSVGKNVPVFLLGTLFAIVWV
jgi:hypothetical protein